MSTSKPKNIYLFYGEDDFSLRRKLDKWKAEFAKKYSPQAVVFLDAGDLGEMETIKQLQNHLVPSLFSSKKLIIIRDGLPKKADQEKLAEVLLDLPAKTSADYFIVFWQSSRPDRRLKFTKQFLALITEEEFALPQGLGLNAWIKAMAKNHQSEISDAAADLLAQFLGRDLFEEKKVRGRVIERKEAFDLWQVNSELTKLAAATDKIEVATVKALIRPKIPDSVFALSDAMAQGRRQDAFQALRNYLEGAGGDEKFAFIKIIGLLAEQFRSMLIVSVLAQSGQNPAAVAASLGWSSGRVFVVSKHAQNFSVDQLKTLLKQLLVIDIKLKSSDTDPELLMDLFLTRA